MNKIMQPTIAIVLILSILACGSSTPTVETQNDSPAAATPISVAEQKTNTPIASSVLPATYTPPPTNTPKPTKTPMPTKTSTPLPTLTFTPDPNFLKKGTHRVGRDMKPGLYIGNASRSCYWARLQDMQGTLDSIIANDNAKGQYYIQVLDTDFALEHACPVELYDLSNAQPDFKTIYPLGSYLVGIDIAPGLYSGEADESCYWQRSSSALGDFDSIIANDNVEGNFYIEVLPSDFMLTVGCGFIKAK